MNIVWYDQYARYSIRFRESTLIRSSYGRHLSNDVDKGAMFILDRLTWHVHVIQASCNTSHL